MLSNSAAVRYYTQSESPARIGTTSSKPPGRAPAFEDVLRLAEQGDRKAVERSHKWLVILALESPCWLPDLLPTRSWLLVK